MNWLGNALFNNIMKRRLQRIRFFQEHPHEVQQDLMRMLISQSKKTEFGRRYGFKDIKTINDYRNQVPLYTYETLYPYIERLLKGEQKLLWPTPVQWFAKSSGTTNARSKFIPVTKEALKECHFKGGKDMLTLYINNYENAGLLTGRHLAIGGSHSLNRKSGRAETYYGDVSAVIIKNLPLWVQLFRTPPLEVALMEEWEAKIALMAEVTMRQNVTSIAGVPTWTLVLLQLILEKMGKQHIKEVWPNLEVFYHGAVAFDPYRPIFDKLVGPPGIRYFETYNASEGFFGLQDQTTPGDMLLMLDYGIFYEFIPQANANDENPKALSLEEVELGKSYAMVISTNAGLWRYKIGDTIRFTSLKPYRIKITGRTKHFINAFGEELVIENAERGIAEACAATGAAIDNYTAGPIYLDGTQKGGHEWAIEFTQPPDNLDTFIEVLDETLKAVNSDYAAKRHRDLALLAPRVHSLPEGTFYAWMKNKGKLGGQNKVPRLVNNRDILDDVLQFLEVM